jgi:carboxylate-amine ligase
MITIGLEEELQVVDATSLALTAHDVEEGRLAIPDAGGTSSCELHQCVLEVQTPVCRNLDGLLDSLARMRTIAAARAARHGHRVLSAGLHPFSDWRTQPVREDATAYPLYSRLLDEYADVARGGMSFGLHLHFGLPDTRSRIEVLNRLRERLPCVLALSASAPYIEGRDTGLHSWRHAVLDRWPRMGLPGIWGSDGEYVAHVERLRKVGVLAPDQNVWEDIRLHHRYGTLEVRICDATPSLNRVWLIAALLLCEVYTLDSEAKARRAKPCISSALIAENRWRARRYGLSAQFIDWHSDEVLASTAHYFRWLDRLAPAAESLGLLARLEYELAAALQEGTSADCQRAVVENGGSLQDVVRHLIQETQASLREMHAETYA